MKIAVIGINHATATIGIREKVSFTDSQKIEILNQLLDGEVREAVVLSTCNRSELYIAMASIEEGIEQVKAIYHSFCKMIDIETFLFVKIGTEAVEHLFKVAAGLDSIVIGEDQILGQVKDAHQFALDLGASGKVLNKCFREAITTAKMIKAQTKISEYPLSMSYIGIKYLKEKMDGLKGKKVLLIGAGKMNMLALKHLSQEGVEVIYVANRTKCRAEALITQYPKLKAIAYEERYGMIPEVDVVITSTASPHLVIRKEACQPFKHKVHMLDLALPRDIDPSLKEELDVALYDIDDLKNKANENAQTRKALAKVAERFIAEGVEAFELWLQTIKLDPTIQSLNTRCQIIQQDTMHYISRKINLSAKEEKIIEKMIMSSLKRLIREPITNLKDTKDEDKQKVYIQLIEELFELQERG